MKESLNSMKQARIPILILILLATTATFFTGCSPQEPATVKMALLPIVDVLPMYVAEQNGYFEEAGIQVELLPVKSPQERDALMQANEVDGMLTDLHGVGLFNQESVQVKALIKARKAYPDAPLFRLLAAPGSGIAAPADLAGVKIGVSKNTIIEYLTDRMLEGSGLSGEQIVVENIAAIPVRFEQLMNGQIQAATLPDPLASGAIAAGAALVVDDSQFTQYSQSVLAFSVESIEDKSEAIEAFLTAWNRAVTDLNADPAAYRDLLIEKGRVPESVQGSYAMPPFPEGEITNEAEWADVVDWLTEKGLLEREIPYDEAVDASFLK
jgi:NitT/TauT family transport system substrate-binding protein